MPTVVKRYCSQALVLHRGRGKMFDDRDLALDIDNDLQRRGLVRGGKQR